MADRAAVRSLPLGEPSSSHTADAPVASHDETSPEPSEAHDDDGHGSDSQFGPVADSNPSDHDSSFGDELSSTRSASLTSTVYDYTYENGRRYHARRGTSLYNLPNDEFESDRLDLQHHLFLLTLGGKLHRAPISDVQYALDVGTGTGIWALDFADLYPSAQVIGTDLSPIQPGYVPPNCQFYVDDMEAEWNFEQPFDYIHGRMVVVGMRNWPTFFRQCAANLKPGGWVEIQDLNFPLRCDDGSAGPDSPPLQWSSFMMAGAAALGIDLTATNQFREHLAAAGLVDITVESYAWPIGIWPRERHEKTKGMWVLENFLQGLQAFTMGYYTRGLGWKKDEVEVFLAGVRDRLKDRYSHVYLPIRVIYARKPPLVDDGG